MSLKYLPVGTSVTLRYLSPIFGAILAIYLLKEKIIPIQWLFFIIAFGGVIILKFSEIEINSLGLSLILGSAFFGGLVYILLNKIGTTEHPLTVVNYFMVFCTIIGGVISIFNWKTPLKEDWLPLLSMGLYGFYGQLYMTKAFQIASVNIIAPLKYIEVIFSVVVGVILLQEVYDIWSILGILMIILGLVLNIIYRK
jgi:drug/metabolite transporter (DMT)-like permease